MKARSKLARSWAQGRKRAKEGYQRGNGLRLADNMGPKRCEPSPHHFPYKPSQDQAIAASLPFRMLASEK